MKKILRNIFVFVMASLMMLSVFSISPIKVNAETVIKFVNVLGVAPPEVGGNSTPQGISVDHEGVKMIDAWWMYTDKWGTYRGQTFGIPLYGGRQYTVSILVEPKEGYVFKNPFVANVYNSSVSVTPAENGKAIIEYQFDKLPGDAPIQYNIKVTNGKAKHQAKHVGCSDKGDYIDLYADDPPEGKAFDKWVVKSGGINLVNPHNTVSGFTMPLNDVEVEATYRSLSQISQIDFIGITPPVIGALPTIEGIKLKEGQEAFLESFSDRSCFWGRLDQTGWVGIDKDTPFEPGKKYSIGFNINLNPGDEFSEDFKVTINGNEATEIKTLTNTSKIAEFEFDALEGEVPTYNVNIINGKAFIGDDVVTSAEKYANILIAADYNPEGKVFDKWVVESGGVTLEDEYEDQTMFKMSDSDVTIKANFKDIIKISHVDIVGVVPPAQNMMPELNGIQVKQEGLSIIHGEGTAATRWRLSDWHGGDWKQTQPFELGNYHTINVVVKTALGYEFSLNPGDTGYSATVNGLEASYIHRIAKNVLEIEYDFGMLDYEKRTVSFDANGGSGTMEPVQRYLGTHYKLPENKFIAPEGKVFYGWEVKGEEKLQGKNILVDDDITVKAIWRDNSNTEHNIEVYLGKAYFGDGSIANKAFAGTEIFLKPDTPDGKYFYYWKVTDGDAYISDIYDENASFIMRDNYVRVAATYEDIPESVYVTFKPAGGSGTMQSVKLNYKDDYILPENEFNPKEEHRFKCWRVDDVEKEPGDVINVGLGKTVYAVWKKIEYANTAYFLDGGILNGQTHKVITIDEMGKPITILEGPIKKGYKFLHWYHNYDKINYYPGDSYIPLGSYSFTAIYEKNPTHQGSSQDLGELHTSHVPSGEMNPVLYSNTKPQTKTFGKKPDTSPYVYADLYLPKMSLMNNINRIETLFKNSNVENINKLKKIFTRRQKDLGAFEKLSSDNKNINTDLKADATSIEYKMSIMKKLLRLLSKLRFLYK